MPIIGQKLTEVENVILRHIPEDGRKVLRTSVIAKTEKDYIHDKAVTLEDIAGALDGLVQREVLVLDKSGDRRMRVGRKIEPATEQNTNTDEEQASPPSAKSPAEPRVTLLQAVREVAPGIIEGAREDGAVRMDFDTALKKAIQRDEFFALRDKWVEARDNLVKAEAALSVSKEKVKKRKEDVVACEMKLVRYGFESEASREAEKKEAEKKRKKAEREAAKAAETGQLFNPPAAEGGK